MTPAFYEDGFAVYDHDTQIAAWACAVHPLAQKALLDQHQLDTWLVCQGTWFVGVDALETGPSGEAEGTALDGAVIRDLRMTYQVERPLHKAQLSVVYPGYPKSRDGESDAAFAYRKKRDAAHVDGLHALGTDRKRHLVECHAYLLGLPINDASKGASPLVVWRGSHKIVRDWLSGHLSHLECSVWKDVDLTESYQAIRRKIFATCERVEVPVAFGQAVAMHRHALHGVAPWRDEDGGKTKSRMIAYFRPQVSQPLAQWLELP